MKTFTFELSEPIEYSAQGELRDGKSITFYAPKPSQRKRVMKLKQAFFQSLPKATGTEAPREKQTNTEDPEIDGDAVLLIIAQSDTDYAEFIETGRFVLCDNGKIEDAVSLTSVTLDKVSMDDMEQMVGQYVANFIVKSALSSLGKS